MFLNSGYSKQARKQASKFKSLLLPCLLLSHLLLSRLLRLPFLPPLLSLALLRLESFRPTLIHEASAASAAPTNISELIHLVKRFRFK